ncbi:MAG: CcmD family protein [Eggerthellaceae bacterium]|nr:CcmD family protein [Eggerthellaceae bacterium]
MNPVLEEIYSTVLPSAPYVIIAYALIWVILLAYILVIMRGTKKAEEQLELIEEALQDQAASAKRDEGE